MELLERMRDAMEGSETTREADLWREAIAEIERLREAKRSHPPPSMSGDWPEHMFPPKGDPFSPYK